MIADIQIRSELRRREIKLSANHAVAHDDGQEYDRSTEGEECRCPHTVAQKCPAQDYGNEDNRVLARQAQGTDRKA